MKTSRLDEAQKGFNFTNSMINIDSVMDSIVAAQKAAGEEPTMEIAVVDRFTGKKYRRFQKRSAKEEESYQESKRMLSTMTRPEEPKISPDGEVKEEDENDGLYICEYCTKLKCPLGQVVPKYDSSICDNCTECAECVEFAEYECSGCSYSRYREGVPYSELVSADKVLTDHDMETFKEIDNARKTGRSLHKPYDYHYTILDF